jgi:hypothetical protein
MKKKLMKAQLSGEQRVLNMIRDYGHITRQVADTLGIKSLSSTINRLRNKGWGVTARQTPVARAIHSGTKLTIYTFTERQCAQPLKPVYKGAAPKHSRYHHKF